MFAPSYGRVMIPVADGGTRTGASAMSHEWHDLVGHHVWANDQLLAFCLELDGPTLDATVPGTYGTILETLRHLFDAEMLTLYPLTGAWSTRPWREDEAVGLE